MRPRKNRIREFRRKKHITQAELAKLANVSARSISTYESGKREPKIETLVKIANILDVPVTVLEGYRDEEITLDMLGDSTDKRHQKALIAEETRQQAKDMLTSIKHTLEKIPVQDSLVLMFLNEILAKKNHNYNKLIVFLLALCGYLNDETSKHKADVKNAFDDLMNA